MHFSEIAKYVDKMKGSFKTIEISRVWTSVPIDCVQAALTLSTALWRQNFRQICSEAQRTCIVLAILHGLLHSKQNITMIYAILRFVLRIVDVNLCTLQAHKKHATFLGQDEGFAKLLIAIYFLVDKNKRFVTVVHFHNFYVYLCVRYRERQLQMHTWLSHSRISLKFDVLLIFLMILMNCVV